MDTTLQDPLVGQVLDGRYRIDARIAVGGMATVYRAVDTRLDRVLALKVMHPTLAADAAFVDRFIREAKSVARLAHPNVVAVFDQGAQGAYVYLAMEYVAGCTLRDVLRERGALQPRAALDILEPVLAALGAAHRAGFVHRDMKPENVLIGDDGRVKVADFGLVRSVDTVTNTTGAVLGTISYLAPEQIERGEADPRVDVYACGVVLYEMLTGAKPHTGESPAQILYKHLHEDIPPPSAAVPGLPVDLDELVALATARNPEVRPYDAAALLGRTLQARAALTEAQLDAVPPAAVQDAHSSSEDRTSVIPRAVASVPRPLPAEEQLNRTSRFEMPPPPPAAPAAPGRAQRPRRGMYTVIAAVILALGIGAGVWYINSGQFTQVPLILAKTEAEARKKLEDAGLRVNDEVRRKYSAAYDRGTVMDSDPDQGKRIRSGGEVTLTVSLGQRIVRVPDVSGSSLDEAKKELQKAGLEPGTVTREFSDEVRRGDVIRTSPTSGTQRKSGTAVAITVSKGEPVEVPDVTGKTPDEARAELEEDGLKVEISQEQVHSEHDKGLVGEQSPGGGASLAEGDTVTLKISKGPEMVEVPDVVGMKVGEAKDELTAAGFEVDEDRGFLGLFGDTVESQSVEGGEEAAKGSTITIKIR
ncbi:Stk1 family PASTA domain-containing Ser/Thr kinase [Streptomyces sp. TRM66268-LWL]|uniref:non-specific serine/threonine protein kinase n=1 Tax=Streptomyces polyasparticus TaxID=2767826 RepID=A0ABR7S9T7_9ACTN|nr:Stk1 family PASTA domain-containing Ser/Thr kinase [Streptomyces polyasparticus]MBC9712252.1 Stk1 family PASTA domain-containing Ser/Thr kinase [Streptomyces polyasparticus]